MSARVKKWGNKRIWELFVYVSVLGRGLDGALGVDGGVLPLATHTQQYGDPVSLVQRFFKREQPRFTSF